MGAIFGDFGLLSALFSLFFPTMGPCILAFSSLGAMVSEDIFSVYKNSNKTETPARWRKVIRENKKMFRFSGLATLAVIMRSIPLKPKINRITRPLDKN